jgi:hypothetical protein
MTDRLSLHRREFDFTETRWEIRYIHTARHTTDRSRC